MNRPNPTRRTLSTRSPNNEQRLSIESRQTVAVNTTAASNPPLADLQKAIDVLTRFYLADTSIVQPCAPGDLFLQYDLAIGSHRKPVFRIKDRRVLHDALTTEGAPTALENFEVTLLELMRPLKNRVSSMVNQVLRSTEEERTGIRYLDT